MDWQKIMDKTLEIAELQQELLLKSQDEIINQIVKRKEKYLDKGAIDIQSLNNAILEHQIVITPYQITILSKINDLSLNTDPQSIYINMPESYEDAKEYVANLKDKYQLAIKSFDLVMAIENISKTEYNFNYQFDKSIYAKKRNIENEIFLNFILNHKEINKEMLEILINNKIREFITSLSVDEKKQLLLESLTLSYDRNVFDFLDKQQLIIGLLSKEKSNLNDLVIAYNYYKNFLNYLENHNLLKMSLSEICDEYKLIYETDIFNQKNIKK